MRATAVQAAIAEAKVERIRRELAKARALVLRLRALEPHRVHIVRWTADGSQPCNDSVRRVAAFVYGHEECRQKKGTMNFTKLERLFTKGSPITTRDDVMLSLDERTRSRHVRSMQADHVTRFNGMRGKC